MNLLTYLFTYLPTYLLTYLLAVGRCSNVGPANGTREDPPNYLSLSMLPNTTFAY